MQWMNFLKGWVRPFIEAIIIILVLHFICWPVNIDGISMEETFYPGDKVFISKVDVLLNRIETGDIVVCKVNDNGKNINIIKRVVAFSGDHLVISHGEIYVNGILLEEDGYISDETYGEIDLILPENSVFVLGDNRLYSKDSRAFGPIPKKDIKGRVILRFYPFNHIQTF